jgi:hypothetical protein
VVNIATVNKDQAIQDWIKTGAESQNVLFNFLTENADSFAIVPIAGNPFEKQYLGGALKRYNFALQAMQNLSQTTDDVNTRAMLIMRQWQDWIEEQERTKNYPDFGAKCSDYKLENLSNMPQLAEIFQDGKAGKYQFVASLRYYEKK